MSAKGPGKIRPYRDPPYSERCEHSSKIYRSQQSGQCGRRKVLGSRFCRQHRVIEARRYTTMQKAAGFIHD